MSTTRFHVYIDEKRTTATMPIVLSELLALKLKTTPKTPEARKAVTRWLQDQIDYDPGEFRYRRASQRLNHRAILAVAAPGLVDKHDTWMIGDG